MSTKMPVNEGDTVLMDGGKLANKAVLSKFICVCVCVCVCVYSVMSGSLQSQGL